MQKSPTEAAQTQDKNKQKEEEKRNLLQRQVNQARQWEKNIDIDEQRNDEGISTVFFAIRAGNLSCLKLLRKYGANFNLECISESKQPMRPIQYAVYRGNMAIFELVVECNSS